MGLIFSGCYLLDIVDKSGNLMLLTCTDACSLYGA